ncbi:MAG: acyl-CoA dehydrogenase family protein [Candidatus Lambdaproteobacteria bacterium]|nr:acyl-CoA dehydrogenase family protein [Candidatus Lambdaproteobacteria bacterium]
MNLKDTPQQARLRQEIRAWIAAAVPTELLGQQEWLAMPLTTSTLADELAGRPEYEPLLDALDGQGWLAPAWPREHGGAAFSAEEQFVFDEEWLRAGLPPFRTDGLEKVGPTLIALGTPEQQARFLEPTRRRRIVWAQGYSEPGAGSDLASLALRAEPKPGGYRLNGQKAWTSNAHRADWLYVLARTDPAARPRHAGISLFLADARSAGITVRPIVAIDGYHHLNQTLFENVFVPEAQLVGGLNQGWKAANFLLGYERFSHPSAMPVYHDHALAALKRDARAMPGEGGPDGTGGSRWDDPGLQRSVARLEMDTDCLRYARYRAQTRFVRRGEPGPESSIFKLYGGALMQRIVETHHELTGPRGMAWDAQPFGPESQQLARRSARVRAYSISGGTQQIQRNVIAQRILGLPGQ